MWRGTKLLREAKKKGHVPARIPFLIKTERIHMQLVLTWALRYKRCRLCNAMSRNAVAPTIEHDGLCVSW
jgi:hypothetical protein